MTPFLRSTLQCRSRALLRWVLVLASSVGLGLAAVEPAIPAGPSASPEARGERRSKRRVSLAGGGPGRQTRGRIISDRWRPATKRQPIGPRRRRPMNERAILAKRPSPGPRPRHFTSNRASRTRRCRP